jgi:hypothetical protein
LEEAKRTMMTDKKYTDESTGLEYTSTPLEERKAGWCREKDYKDQTTGAKIKCTPKDMQKRTMTTEKKYTDENTGLEYTSTPSEERKAGWHREQNYKDPITGASYTSTRADEKSDLMTEQAKVDSAFTELVLEKVAEGEYYSEDEIEAMGKAAGEVFIQRLPDLADGHSYTVMGYGDFAAKTGGTGDAIGEAHVRVGLGMSSGSSCKSELTLDTHVYEQLDQAALEAKIWFSYDKDGNLTQDVELPLADYRVLGDERSKQFRHELGTMLQASKGYASKKKHLERQIRGTVHAPKGVGPPDNICALSIAFTANDNSTVAFLGRSDGSSSGETTGYVMSISRSRSVGEFREQSAQAKDEAAKIAASHYVAQIENPNGAPAKMHQIVVEVDENGMLVDKVGGGVCRLDGRFGSWDAYNHEIEPDCIRRSFKSEKEAAERNELTAKIETRKTAQVYPIIVVKKGHREMVKKKRGESFKKKAERKKKRKL